ncbi:MAG: MFS transporter [Verrucomicrobiae bacterium]|nr:MFS transporter [Verrucomicrobiae bacterium]
MRKPSLAIIFLTVFIDLIGFGIVLPLLPRYIERFGGKGALIGLVIGSFSLMQFIFSPIWGRISDRVGRRPILLISNAGSAIAYTLFALAADIGGTPGLLLVLVSRVFAGICGANISVASAYIADITPVERRSRSMALIGLAFGLGFIFGPAIGAFGAKAYGLAGPGWVAAGLCGFNFVLSIFILKESLQTSSVKSEPRPRLEQWIHTFRQPKLGGLIGLYFLATFCFTSFEATLPLLLAKAYKYDETQLGYIFSFCGVIAALTQGGLIGVLVKRFGDGRLISISLVVVGVSLALMPLAGSIGVLLILLAVFSAASNVNRTPTMGQISVHAPPGEQGATLGIAQSAGTLARVFGPTYATALYGVNTNLSFLVTAFLTVAGGIFAWKFLVSGASASRGVAAVGEKI